jgi:hypothetical protein
MSSEFDDTEWESESSEDEIDGLEGAELVESLRKEVESELLKQAAETPYEKISNGNLTTKDWKRAEQNRGLGYDGHASRTQRKHSQNARRLKVTRLHGNREFNESLIDYKYLYI